MSPCIQRLMSASQNREKAATSRAFDDPVAGQAGATKKRTKLEQILLEGVAILPEPG